LVGIFVEGDRRQLLRRKEGVMRISEEDFRVIWDRRFGDQAVGHDHFWSRALSRRRFLGTAALAGGAALTSSAWPSLIAQAADGGTPVPIPGGIMPLGPGTELFHVNLPAANTELSTIFNFNGLVGVIDTVGSGTGTDKPPTNFAADVRFMKGKFVDAAGRHHRGTFAFV
jgi:hypothetical protein